MKKQTHRKIMIAFIVGLFLMIGIGHQYIKPNLGQQNSVLKTTTKLLIKVEKINGLIEQNKQEDGEKGKYWCQENHQFMAILKPLADIDDVPGAC